MPNNSSRAFVFFALNLLLLLFSSIGHAKTPNNYDSIAIIIGNKDYSVRGTPSVKYALNDAKIMKKFLVQKLGYRPGNVKILENATYNEMRRWFGDKTEQKGILWNRVRKGRSNVFVYYSGHGAPDQRSKKPFLIPSDVDPNRARYGYELGMLESNLELVKRKIGKGRQVILMLDACFSGKTAGGEPLLAQSRGAYKPKMPARLTKKGVIRIAASGPLQVANWDNVLKHGLFTGRFIKAIEGEADQGRFGNNDGIVSWNEIKTQLEDEVPYLARSRGGADQVPEFPQNASITWKIKAGALRRDDPAIKSHETKDKRANDQSCSQHYQRALQSTNRRAALYEFVTHCPTHTKASAAQQLIEGLADAENCERCLTTKSLKSCKYYKMAHPNGECIRQAGRVIASILDTQDEDLKQRLARQKRREQQLLQKEQRLREREREIERKKQRRRIAAIHPPQPPARPERFEAYGRGIIQDNRTGLLWVQSDNGYDISWNEAKRYVRKLGNGWRLPTISELKSLYNRNNTNPHPASYDCSGGYHVASIVKLSCGALWASNKCTKGGSRGLRSFNFASGKRNCDNPSGSGKRRVLAVQRTR